MSRFVTFDSTLNNYRHLIVCSKLKSPLSRQYPAVPAYGLTQPARMVTKEKLITFSAGCVNRLLHRLSEKNEKTYYICLSIN